MTKHPVVDLGLPRADGGWLVAGTPWVALLDEDMVVRWSLDLSVDPALTPDQRRWLSWYHGAMDEARWSRDGDQVLMTSVAGAVATVTAASGVVQCRAWLPGAHAVETLPGGLLAVAVSTPPAAAPGMDPGAGHAVVLVGSEGPLQTVPLWTAHGVLWDAHRGVLWALGDRLLVLTLEAGRLRVMAEIPTPGPGGHDLVADGADGLWCSFQGQHAEGIDAGVWRFDRRHQAWTSTDLPGLRRNRVVKSLAMDPGRGVMWIAGGAGHTADRLRYADGELVLPFPTYKARRSWPGSVATPWRGHTG